VFRLTLLVLLATLNTANAQSIPPERDVIDVFMECATPQQKANYLKVLQKRLQGKPDALRFSSDILPVPNTDHQVTGNTPPCFGDVSLDDQAKEFVGAFEAACATADALGAGGLATSIGNVLLGAAGALGLFENNTHQTNANCTPVCAAVTGTNLKGMTTNLLFWNTPRDSPQPRNGEADWGNWSHFEPIKPYQTNAKFKSKIGDGTTDCPVTLVCSQLRNWSHNRVRQGQLVVDLPMDNVSSACSDYSIVNRDLYEHVMYIEVKEPSFTALTYYKNVVDCGRCDCSGPPSH
jgi:hypothetical protein